MTTTDTLKSIKLLKFAQDKDKGRPLFIPLPTLGVFLSERLSVTHTLLDERKPGDTQAVHYLLCLQSSLFTSWFSAQVTPKFQPKKLSLISPSHPGTISA